MKSLGKNILVVLTLGIVLTSVISQSHAISSSQNEQSSISQRIDDMEDDIEAGLIIKDGNVEKDEPAIITNHGTISSVSGKIGSFVTRLIGKIIEFFAKLFGNLVS